METEAKHLKFAILEYLHQLSQNSTSSAEENESLQVASQCLASAFSLDINDTSQKQQYSLHPLSLPQIFDLGRLHKEQIASLLSSPVGQTPVNIDLAEQHKLEGNTKLSEKKFHEAIESYSKAIQYNPSNAIYYCNRAAAYTHLNEFEKAISDCEISIRMNPNYGKAYNRLGLCYLKMGRTQEAVEQYRKAVALEPNNSSFQEGLKNAELILSGPNRNLADLLNNPIIQNMAENFRRQQAQQPPPPQQQPQPQQQQQQQSPPPPQDQSQQQQPQQQAPNLQNILNDPNFMNIAQQAMSEPSISQLLNDPNIRNMATNLMQNPDAMSQMLKGLFPGNQPDNSKPDNQ